MSHLHTPKASAYLHWRAHRGGRIPRTAAAFMAGLLWSRFRGRVALLSLTAMGGVGLMAFEPLFLRNLVDALQAVAGGRALADAVWAPFAVVAGAWLVSAVFNRLREVVDIYTAPQLRYEAQTLLFSYLIEHSPQFFQENFAGRLAQKVKQVGQALVSLLSILFNEMVRILVAVAIGVGIVGPERPLFAGILLAWTVVYLGLTVVLSRRCLSLSKEMSDEVSASTGTIVDVVTNADLVRAFARGPMECLRVAGAVRAEQRASMRLRWFLTFMWFVLFNSLLAFQIGFNGLAVSEALAGRMTVGDVVMMFSLSAILVGNVWGLSMRMLDFYEQLGVLESALDTILQPHGIADRPGALPLSVGQGGIVLEGVRFSHANGTPVFEDLDLAIRPGEKIGLVGPSGSGKSTLVRLLRRQYEAQSGRILIDGQDILEVTLDSLNEAVAEVPQAPGLFHRTIEENIRYARPDAEPAQMLEAARKAHADEFVARRPEGYQAVVGEQGIRLSGGERQRVAIARAFLKDARILILDEATSALDSETEHVIREALWDLFEGRTVIAIAHRLSTIAHMDRILYLEQGRIIEQGTHEELLARGGAYARLWQRQVDGFIG